MKISTFTLIRFILVCWVVIKLSLVKVAIADTSSGDSLLRDYPYPFGNSLAFASDVDMQTPEVGERFHSIINQGLGLPISDSLWVKTDAASLSGIFRSHGELNREAVLDGKSNDIAFSNLVKNWHRGNIDHFHSWHTDSEVVLRYEFDESFENGVRQAFGRGVGYYIPKVIPDHFVISSKEALPTDTSIRLYHSPKIKDERRIFEYLLRDAEVQFSQDTSEYYYIFPTDFLRHLPLSSIGGVSFNSSTCGYKCFSNIIALSFADFSRADVLSKFPILDEFDIRPFFLSSHGGKSFLQNYSKKPFDSVRNHKAPFIGKNIDNHIRVRGNSKGFHSYHTDLLRHFGTRVVWPYNQDNWRSLESLKPHLERLSADSFLYSVARNRLNGIDVSDKNTFIRSIRQHTDILDFWPRKTIEQLYCGPNCGVAQGDFVPILIAASLASFKKNRNRNYLWYTHFGSGGAFDHQRKEYFIEHLDEWFGFLASSYYGLYSAIDTKNRPWVSSATTWLNYRINFPYVKSNTSVSQDGNSIYIDSWLDETTGTLHPSAEKPSSELHGMTFLVKDNIKASVFLDGVNLPYLMPSKDKKSGQNYLTVVDLETPSTVIGGLEMADWSPTIVQSDLSLDCRNAKEACFRPLKIVPDTNQNVKFRVLLNRGLYILNSPMFWWMLKTPFAIALKT